MEGFAILLSIILWGIYLAVAFFVIVLLYKDHVQ